MVAKAKVIEREFELHEYVSAAVEESDDACMAAKKLEVWAREDEKLYQQLTEPWLSKACYQAVRSKYRLKRQAIWHSEWNSNQERPRARVLAYANLLMDFPLLDGKPLRSAKKAAVLEAADFYGKQSSDMRFKEIWLRAIAKKQGVKKVEQVFTETSLRKLRKDLSHD